MEDYVAYIIGRMPGCDSQIRYLMGGSTLFQSLVRRHYEPG